jgi:Predicted ATPase
MIETLETINSKSFDNYFCSEKLSGVNLFFGTNGSGKSALSNGFSLLMKSIQGYLIQNMFEIIYWQKKEFLVFG